MKINPERIKKGMYWDRAWSLVEGCAPVSEGCLNCWSASQSYIRSHQQNPKIRARHEGLTHMVNGRPTFNGKIRLMWDDIEKPLHVKKPTVWAIWNDLFHEDVPYSFILEVFKTIAKAPRHTFILLTKRPDNAVEFYNYINRYKSIVTASNGLSLLHFWPLKNVCLGVTAENQQRADERIPILLQIPAAVQFVSIEPMLGPVDLQKVDWDGVTGLCTLDKPGLNWIILGGESGPGARPMHPDWARSVRDQCIEAGVPFFFKQWGEWSPKSQTGLSCPKEWGTIDIKGNYSLETTPWNGHDDDGRGEAIIYRVGKKAAGRILDGREWNEVP